MTVSTLSLEQGAVQVVPQSVRTNPNLPALFGLFLLALSPFSILHQNLRFAIAGVALVVYTILKPGLLDARPISVNGRAGLRGIYVSCALLLLYALFCSTISIAILLQRGEAQWLEILDRGGKQLGSLLLAFAQVVCGFHMARHFGPRIMRIVIYAILWLDLLLCSYQNLSDVLGLPYLATPVHDPVVGLRPSALAGEPKYLSVYLLCLAAMLIIDTPRSYKSKLVAFVPRALGVFLAGYFFLQTASGNGYSSVFILIAVYFVAFPTARKVLVGIAIGLAILVLAPALQLSDLGLRESHRNLLFNISDVDLTLFDDLIALPMMAWMDNPLSVLIGFGPGLMHFFAHRYFDLATWIERDTTIEGNISAIIYISNYGVLVFSILFVHIFRKAQRIVRSAKVDGARRLGVYFLAVLIVGSFIGSNVSVPFFLSIGWILGTANYENEVPDVGSRPA
jgi:hypothetical protein